MTARAVRTSEVPVDTERGPSRLLVAAPARPAAVLLLGHGAGGGIDSFDLAALAAELPARGIAVARYEQPWRTAGKKIAGPPSSLDGPWRAALAEVVRRWPKARQFVGGHSAGARVACRCYERPAEGVVALSFPLHPPGKPEKSRLPEIADVAGPVLVIQGARDPFGTAGEVRDALGTHPLSSGGQNSSAPRWVVEVPAAGHSLQPGVRSDPAGAAALIVETVADFIGRTGVEKSAATPPAW